MSFFTKAAAWVALLGVLVIGLMMVSAGSADTLSGAVTSNTGHQEVFPWDFGAGIQVGSPSATPVLRLLSAGTCNLATTALPAAASSTIKMTCAAGNNYKFVSTDMVVMDLAANPASFGALFDSGPSFVSTAGQNPTLTTYIYNAAGTATSSFPLATTSAEFFVYRVI